MNPILEQPLLPQSKEEIISTAELSLGRRLENKPPSLTTEQLENLVKNHRPKNRLVALRSHLWTLKPKKIDPSLSRDLERGWLLPYLLTIESQTWGRWDYWIETTLAQKIIDRPIPQISFSATGEYATNQNSGARKHLEKCLDLIPNHGSYSGWGNWQYFDYLMEWILYGFGFKDQTELPEEPHGCEGASMRLYQTFDLHWLLAYPNDYLGDILADNQHGKHLGFFPTPHTVVKLMVALQLGHEGDCRDKSVFDCCMGTGRMLLEASNYSLCLYGIDINRTVVLATTVNAYIYAPWLAKGFKFLAAEVVESKSKAPAIEPLIVVKQLV